MSTKKEHLNDTQTKHEQSFYFPQEFKEHLENLVYGILVEKPTDPLEYAFNFFSEKLKIRDGSTVVQLQKENDQRERATQTTIITTTATNLVPNLLYVSKLENQGSQAQNMDIQSTSTSECLMSQEQAATIIQAYFRGFNVRHNWWKRRYLKTSLNYHDHLSVRRNIDSPRGSFSFCWPEENFLAITNYDSEESVDN